MAKLQPPSSVVLIEGTRHLPDHLASLLFQHKADLGTVEVGGVAGCETVPLAKLAEAGKRLPKRHSKHRKWRQMELCNAGIHSASGLLLMLTARLTSSMPVATWHGCLFMNT